MEEIETLDILITGGTLLTMSNDMKVVKNPVIGIRNGTILFFREKGRESICYDDQETIDASGSVIIPGLINTHTHLPMIAFRGMADDLALMDWLNNHIFPAEAQYVDREMVYHTSMLSIAEMILSGTTTFCDGYFFEDGVAEAAIDAGMRGVPSQGFTDFPTSDIPDPSKRAAVAEAFVRKWSGASPLIHPSLFCHAPYTCSPETLCMIKEITRDSDVPFLIHLAETQDEVVGIKNRYGKTPVRHLSGLNLLDSRTIAVHCIWLDGEEIDILAERGVKVSHAPESNMKLAAGIAPIPEMLKKGVTVGIGTDGCASNNDLDLIGEMGTAARVHKVSSMDPTVMDARTVLRMATIEGAKVLGLDDAVGSIEAGKKADITILGLNKPHLTPLYDEYSHIVYAASGSDVETVIINGRTVMKNRRLLTINEGEAMEEVRKIAKKIKSAGMG
ncbi:MAG TPA: amidohydrolase [Alphaproteobacteria bacterium]|nr:amidohydrolase [Alphaproteobacteria bacterium]HPQ42894.1 amidohydrolase [Syntrophales bacterium]